MGDPRWQTHVLDTTLTIAEVAEAMDESREVGLTDRLVRTTFSHGVDPVPMCVVGAKTEVPEPPQSRSCSRSLLLRHVRHNNVSQWL